MSRGHSTNSGRNPFLENALKNGLLSRQGKKGRDCYEANPMVNCAEPVVLWGTSLT